MNNSYLEICNQLRLEGTLCNVVLKAGGVKFRAHKIIMSACSEYFRVLMTSKDWMCSKETEHTIPDVSPEIMELIIIYAYSGEVAITSDNVQNLLAAADQLGILGIIDLCCKFLEKQLCPHNCIGIWRLAERHWCSDLYQQAYTYTLQNFEEVKREPAEEFLELTLTQLSDLLDDDKLNVRREETVFEAMLMWINHDPATRSGYIAVLLQKVRMGLMNGNYFLDNVRANPLVSSHLEFQPIMVHGLQSLLNFSRTGMTSTCFQDPISRPRLPHSILSAIGGWSLNRATNAIEAYDSKLGSWMTVPWAEEEQRAYHGTVFLDGHLYVIGGFNGIVYFNTVQKYELLTHTWHQVGHMQYCRCYVSVTVLDGRIYAMGGFNGQERFNSVERYNPTTNQWSLIPPMHEIRSDASATTLNGKIYICGGYNGINCIFTSECFNPLTNQWTYIAPMHSSRSGVAVVAFKQQVFAVGGFDGFSRLQTAEAYDPNSNTWRALSSMFHPRSNFGIEVLDDLVFVVGGYNGYKTIASAECYDATKDEWFDIEDMHVARSALRCCLVSGLPNVTEYSVPPHNL